MMPFVPKLIKKFRRWSKTENYVRLFTSHWKMKLWILSSIVLAIFAYFQPENTHRSTMGFIAFLLLGTPICMLPALLILGPIFGIAIIFGQIPNAIDEIGDKFKNWLDR